MADSVSAAYAKAHLPKLLKDVENGKTIVISRYKKPVAVSRCPSSAETASFVDMARQN
jgi:Antitoxin Phd_YefM, type II toxin-antitoxin system